MNDVVQQYLNVLNPEKLRKNLTLMSLFVYVYEIYKTYIMDSVKDFYVHGFCVGGDEKARKDPMYEYTMQDSYYDGDQLISKKYLEQVRQEGKYKYEDSLKWLAEQSVITSNDTNLCDEAREMRNDIVHNRIARLVLTGQKDAEDIRVILVKLLDVLKKIDNWFAKVDLSTQELPGNPEDYDWDEAQSLNYTMLVLMYEVALNPDSEKAEKYYNAFLRKLTS